MDAPAPTMTQTLTPDAGLDLRRGASLTDALLERISLDPGAALMLRPAGDGAWVEVSGGEFLAEASALAKGLLAAGLEAGGRVALFGATSYEWTLCDYAIWFAGGVTVPFYDSSSKDQLSWIITDAEVGFALVHTEDHADRAREAAAAAGIEAGTVPVWVFGDSGLDELRALGADVTDEELEARRSAAGPETLASLIYTSGTTGRSKGCRLTHGNFVQIAAAAAIQVSEVVGPGSRCLLFLPLAHVFARFVQVFALNSGSVLAHTADLGRLTDTFAEVRPTYILGVPRVFEKVFNSARAKAEAGGKGKIFAAAQATAVAYSRALDTAAGPSLALRARHALFDRLVYGKLRAVMGGELEYSVSGGGPLGEHLGHFYRGIGLTIIEGYGLTETTAPVTVNVPGNPKLGTVGKPLPGCAVAVAPDGEVLARGVCVFDGYWKNEEATAETFAGEWLRTGDLGEIDSEGFLSITGRRKELIVTSSGKNVAPAPLEDELRRHPVIGQPLVVGDNRNFIAALVFLDPEMLPGWLENHGLRADMALAEAAAHPQVREAVEKAVERTNEKVSRAESIRKFRIVPAELTEANGYLSAKQSVKRHLVVKDFADEIEEMYA
ncbi:AMP-dependent synthetase/ligase [Brevibacterium album]|uniref:AMP-dependent synthetase/ligase n=1 Tax=Brevibacterium album TaxID=417948 RepID=UPI000403AB5E|nr:long-chain fatty acid--CoA ligase [Brevibacterium album]